MKTQFWTVPEVHFKCDQENTYNQNMNAQKSYWGDIPLGSTEYMLQCIQKRKPIVDKGCGLKSHISGRKEENEIALNK